MDYLIDFVFEFLARAVTAVDFASNALLMGYAFILDKGIMHPMVLIPLILFSALSVVCLWALRKRSNKAVRTKTKSQKVYLSEANTLFDKAKSTNQPPEEIHSWAKSRRFMNGWAFELFVMKALAEKLGNVVFMGDVKLTADAGFDGVIVTEANEIFFLQSKFYSNYLTSSTFTQLAASVARFNKRKKSNKWHKVLGIPSKFCRNTSYIGYPVVAYTGKISAKNKELADKLGVKLMDWDELVSSIRANRITKNASAAKTSLEMKSELNNVAAVE